jgi:hypothetical protein
VRVPANADRAREWPTLAMLARSAFAPTQIGATGRRSEDCRVPDGRRGGRTYFITVTDPAMTLVLTETIRPARVDAPIQI